MLGALHGGAMKTSEGAPGTAACTPMTVSQEYMNGLDPRPA
jgi:hypothetical protein